MTHSDTFSLGNRPVRRMGYGAMQLAGKGGFTPIQSSALSKVAASLGATPMQVALAWLLNRAPNILLIPGTSSLGHLRENLDADKLELKGSVLAELNAIAGGQS